MLAPVALGKTSWTNPSVCFKPRRLSVFFVSTAASTPEALPVTQGVTFSGKLKRLKQHVKWWTFKSIKLKPYGANGIHLGYQGPHSQPMLMLRDVFDPAKLPDGVKIVRWPRYAITPIGIPQQTHGMCNCSALHITGPEDHYVIHLSPHANISDIVDHFEEDIPWALHEDAYEINLVPGTAKGTAGTVNRLRWALYQKKSALLNKIQFRHFPAEAARYGPNDDIHNPVSIVAYLGLLLCHPVASRNPVFQPGGHIIRPYLRDSNE